jgi:hypothetical protein
MTWSGVGTPVASAGGVRAGDEDDAGDDGEVGAAAGVPEEQAVNMPSTSTTAAAAPRVLISVDCSS